MIALRAWLRAHGSSAKVSLLLAFIVVVLVWAHSGGEAQAMPDEQVGHDAIALCLGVLTGVLAAGLGVAAFAATGARRPPSWTRPCAPIRELRPCHTERRRPPPRAGPAALQVFLR